MPANVARADQNDLKPNMGRVRRLMKRWSCSTMLFKYLHWRILTRLFSSVLNCFIAAVLAPLLSILIKLGLPLDPMALFKKRRAAFLSRLAVSKGGH